MPEIVVAALYHFTRFDAPDAIKPILESVCRRENIKGSLILASEGVNGTIAGTRAGIDAVLGVLRDLPGCADLEHKESFASAMPFLRMKVRLKAEIVTMGQPDIDPRHTVGTYIAPQDWNELIAREDVVLIDTRNDYEVGIGTFEGAIDPKTESFREFPDWWKENQPKFEGKKVAMFCTGGIRCEKASSYLKQEGVDEVFHLKGGILKYLEEVAPEQSTWDGECFVFDQRVAVKHGLEEGSYALCYACRMPLSETELVDPRFRKGVCCPKCADTQSAEQRARFEERQKQVELAAARGRKHIG